MKNFRSASYVLVLLFLFISPSFGVNPQVCKPSGIIRGRKLPACNHEDGFECCLPNKLYPIYTCSPPVSNSTKAVLSLISFQSAGDVPTTCDNEYHSDSELIVALSTGWLNSGERCLRSITITANGRSVRAKVVDECDSTGGCDADHDYQPPCGNNIVEASMGVWKALDVPEDNWGEMDITWSDTHE